MSNPLVDLTSALNPKIQKPEKLTFQRIDSNGELTSNAGDSFSVQYNPTELAFAKTAQFADIAIPGLAAPIIQFVRGDAETVSIDLTIDATDEGMGDDAEGVTAKVHEFHRFVQIDGEIHATPLVRLSWSQGFPGNAYSNAETPSKTFDAVVLSVSRRFTLFNVKGVPLRAIVSLALREYIPLANQLAAINYQSPDHTREHVVQEGETLPLIAHDAYGDVRQWRVIAEFNNIFDVRKIAPGTRLVLPPTR